MKCPKCGYNSFEYLDSCKKCNNDFSSFKTSNGIRAIVLPFRAMERPAAKEETSSDYSPEPGMNTAGDTGMFSWNETSSEGNSMGSLELNLPEPEAEPFSFDLDLPSMEAEPAPADNDLQEMSFDDLCGEEQQMTQTEPQDEFTGELPASPTESAFGDFSFDDLYSEKETTESSPEMEKESASSWEGLTPSGLEENEEKCQTNDSVENLDMGRFESEPAVDEAPDICGNPFAIEEASSDNNLTTTETDPEDEVYDSMGLSPEEYEALFGEPPKKKALS